MPEVSSERPPLERAREARALDAIVPSGPNGALRPADERTTTPRLAGVRRRYAWLSIVVATLVLGLKLFAAARTGSAAILADALESFVNLAASLLVLLAVRYAEVPADEDHPFGHGRAEALSAGVEGALLVAAALGILGTAVSAWLTPRTLVDLGLGLAIVAFTTAVNFGVGRLLIRVGRRHRSMALVADGQHLVGDAMTSVALLVGVGLTRATGIVWLDPLVAAGLGLWVAWIGLRVLRTAVKSLLNEQTLADVERVARALRTGVPAGISDPHDLRILDGGTERFVGLRVRAPAAWSLGEVDAARRELEALLDRAFEGPVITLVQVLPAEAKVDGEPAEQAFDLEGLARRPSSNGR